MINPRLLALVAFVLFAAATRLLPHPPNLTAVTAMALFGGAYFADRRWAFAAPLLALLLSDLALGFYPHMEVPYLGFVLVVCIGLRLQKQRTAGRIFAATLLSSVLFFVLTNFGEWLWRVEMPYPKTLDGLIACYVNALPFFRNTLLGDLIYTALLFGGFRLLESRFSVLRESRPAPVALPQ